jgi:hypothetical protein
MWHFGHNFAHQSVFPHELVVYVSDTPALCDGLVRKDEFVRKEQAGRWRRCALVFSQIGWGYGDAARTCARDESWLRWSG